MQRFLSSIAISSCLENSFDLRGELKPLYGYCDQNVLLQTSGNERYVVKVTSDVMAETLSVLELQISAMAHLETKALNTNSPAVIFSKDLKPYVRIINDDNGCEHAVWVISFLQGTLLDEVDRYERPLLYSVGAAVAEIDAALLDFRHVAADRFLVWDIRHLLRLQPLCRYVESTQKRAMLTTVFQCFERYVVPALENGLPMSVIHNDGGNQHNMLISTDEQPYHCTGIIDFGDTVLTHTLMGLGISAAYASFGHSDKLWAIAQLAAGYHQHLPLKIGDFRLLPWLVAARLTQTVCHAAEKACLEPDNEYALVSAQPAWETLYQLFDSGLEQNAELGSKLLALSELSDVIK